MRLALARDGGSWRVIRRCEVATRRESVTSFSLFLFFLGGGVSSKLANWLLSRKKLEKHLKAPRRIWL